MIYRMVPFPVTLSDPVSRSWVIRPIDALDVLCAQLTRDLFAIAKFLLFILLVSFLTDGRPDGRLEHIIPLANLEPGGNIEIVDSRHS